MCCAESSVRTEDMQTLPQLFVRHMFWSVAQWRSGAVAQWQELWTHLSEPGFDSCAAVSNPGQVVSNLGQVVSNPGQVVSNLGQVVSNPGQVVSNLGQVVSNPGQVVSNLGQVVSNPGQVVSNPGQVVSYLGQVVSNLGQVVSNPGQVVSLAITSVHSATTSSTTRAD